MSNYLKKIERDYIDGKINIVEKDNLFKNYKSLSSKEQKELDKSIKVDGKGNLFTEEEKKNNLKQAKTKSSRFVNYREERNAFWRSKYPTSRTLFTIFEVLNIIILLFFIIAVVYSITQGGGFGAILTVLPLGFAVILFLLGKELLLFQVDKNYFEYKQAEKYLK